MPNIIAYTLARKIQIYKDANHGELVKFIPKKKLNSMTKVELVLNTTLINHGIPYIWAYVLEGPDAGTAGYIPRYGVHNCFVQNITGAYGENFTGVKYGSYSRGADAGKARQPMDITNIAVHGGAASRLSKAPDYTDEKVHYLDLSLAKAKTCPDCGGKNSDHKLLETESARNIALQIHQHLRTGVAPAGGSFMIGVLEYYRRGKKGATVRDVFCALSDAAKPSAFTKTIAYCQANSITFVEKAMASGDFFNAEGEIIKPRHMSKDDALICAAPKLIQYFMQNKPINGGAIYLSEIWYKSGDHKNYNDAGTIDSCDRCRVVVPPMLCGLKNPYSKEKIGRPKSWQGLDEFIKGD